MLASTAAAYTDWRHGCVAVRSAYRRWMAPSRLSEPFAFHRYDLALIREEQAASLYARMMKLSAGATGRNMPCGEHTTARGRSLREERREFCFGHKPEGRDGQL